MSQKNGNRDRSSQGATRRDPDEDERIPVIVVGLGDVGVAAAAAIRNHRDLELVGAVDPAKAGEALSQLVPGAGQLTVAGNVREAFARMKGGVAVLCGGSTLEAIEGDVLAAIASGLHVVSPCAELAHPAFVDPDLATRLDRAATEQEVAVLGVGVNPGFVFDRLVTTLGSVTGNIRRVEAGRRMDPSGPGGAAVGIGATEAAFERGVEDGSFGHQGLSESCALIAEGLGMEIDEIEEAIDPDIDGGVVVGVVQRAAAFDEGREVIRLRLEVGGEGEREDWIRIEGEAPLELRIPGGIPELSGVAWALANSIRAVVSSEPGVMSVLDLPAGL